MATPRKTRKKTLTQRERRVKIVSKVGMVVANSGWFATTQPQLKSVLATVAPAATVIAAGTFFTVWLILTLVEVKEQ